VSSHSTIEMFKKIKALEDEDPTDLTICTGGGRCSAHHSCRYTASG